MKPLCHLLNYPTELPFVFPSKGVSLCCRLCVLYRLLKPIRISPKNSCSSGLTQDQILRGYHDDSFVTDAAILQWISSRQFRQLHTELLCRPLRSLEPWSDQSSATQPEVDTEVSAAVLVQSDSIQQPRLSNVWRHGSQRQWKQTTGVQRCQCQKQRAQLNHITASLLAWPASIRQPYWLRQPSMPSNRPYWMPTSANNSGI